MASRRSDLDTLASHCFMEEIMEKSSALSAQLRLLRGAHADLSDLENQDAVTWLLPLAEHLAAEIAAVAENELERFQLTGMGVKS